MNSESMHPWRSRCRIAATLVVMVAGLVAGMSAASAANAAQEGNHCISPTGVDLNDRYAISAQIVAPFCAQVDAGDQWTAVALWVMSPSFDVVPAEFVAAGATPREDFLAKFVRLTFVVDPGTAQEATYAFPNSSNLWTGSIDGLDAVNTVTLGTLHPLSVGAHVVEISWSLSGMHCDGLGDVIADNCLPAGEFVFATVAFEVTPAHV